MSYFIAMIVIYVVLIPIIWWSINAIVDWVKGGLEEGSWFTGEGVCMGIVVVYIFILSISTPLVWYIAETTKLAT